MTVKDAIGKKKKDSFPVLSKVSDVLKAGNGKK